VKDFAIPFPRPFARQCKRLVSDAGRRSRQLPLTSPNARAIGPIANEPRPGDVIFFKTMPPSLPSRFQ
jgi:hypothetical protein